MANEASRKALQFADNTKKTALGVKYAKQLFTSPETITAKSTTLILKTLGLDIPEGLIITNEVAQTIMAGQAINDGIEAGQTASELQSAINTSAGSFKTLTSIGEKNGWIDSDSASIVRIGTNLAMIVSSAGTDVTAWVSLALESANVVASKQGLADMQAIFNARDKYNARISPQSKILADTFKDFQEKNISIFGVIAKMAVETPDLWPQVINSTSPLVQAFPDLMMLPVVGASVVGRGESKVYGDWPWPASGEYVLASWSADKIIDFKTLGKTFSRETAAEYFFELLLKPWIYAYSKANDEIISRGNMSMANIAALSYLVKPDGEISDTYDYVNMLTGACLTPYDFGDNILENIGAQFIADNYEGSDISFHEQAVSSKLTSLNATFSAYENDKDTMRKKLMQVKQTDDISILTRFPYIHDKLQSYMDFEKTSFELDPSLGGKFNAKFPEKTVRAWRKLHNYFAVIQMIDTFRSDSYLKNTEYAKHLLPYMPTVAQFDDQVARLSYLSTMRSVNRLAYSKIASILGTDLKKLVRVSGQNDVGASKFTIKNKGS